MPCKEYLDINSRHRNRNEFPNPSHFAINEFYNCDNTFIDPISYASPLCIYTYTNLITNVEVIDSELNTDTNIMIRIDKPSETIKNYYKGLIIKINGDTRKISDICFVSENNTYNVYQIQVNEPMTNIPSEGDIITICPVFDTTNGVFWVPDCIPKFVDTYMLWNDSKQECISIKSFDSKYNIIGVLVDASSTINTWSEDDIYNIRKEKPHEFSITEALMPDQINTTTKIALPIGSYNRNCYKGNFIRITAGPDQNRIFKIIRMIEPDVACIDGKLSVPLAIGTTYEILFSNKDNFSNLSFKKRYNMYICSKIRLLNIIIPSNDRWVEICNCYPYIYVKIENKTNYNANLLFSNNPHYDQATFKIPISNDNCKCFFNNLDAGKHMSQIVSFQPTHPLCIKVFLPNGQLLFSDESDTSSPFEPNPFYQLSLLVEIEHSEK